MLCSNLKLKIGGRVSNICPPTWGSPFVAIEIDLNSRLKIKVVRETVREYTNIHGGI